MAKFLDGKADQIGEAEIVAALRKGCTSFKFFPVLCGSAFKNKGVQMLLDAVVNYLPSPVDITSSGHQPRQAGRSAAHACRVGRRAVRRLRVQDHQRPARQPDVLPRVLGQAHERHDGDELHAR
ncbi:MAG: hypothetical protein U0235_11010 [Polyangiaceae bacterium]